MKCPVCGSRIVGFSLYKADINFTIVGDNKITSMDIHPRQTYHVKLTCIKGHTGDWIKRAYNNDLYHDEMKIFFNKLPKEIKKQLNGLRTRWALVGDV